MHGSVSQSCEYNDGVTGALFIAALVIAIIGALVAARFLVHAWSDLRLGLDRRDGTDRRRGDLPVPMERRRRQRRQ
jgi:hypothetical protein